MNPTILNNNILKPFFCWFAAFSLFCLGWKTKGKVPDIKKFVMIAVPHSSNWDFIFFLLFIFKYKLSVHWMGKHTMFRWPFKWILKRLGGIPVNRLEKTNIVQSMADAYNNSEKLTITIAPSGTRKNVTTWKTGFYHIASLANVPIVCGYIDYKHKIVGVGPVISPSGNLELDLESIKSFYVPFPGKYVKALN